MKKVLVEAVREDAEYYCDKHPDRQCYSELKTLSWYGSGFDNMVIEIHLCDECLKQLYAEIKKNFDIEPKDVF